MCVGLFGFWVFSEKLGGKRSEKVAFGFSKEREKPIYLVSCQISLRFYLRLFFSPSLSRWVWIRYRAIDIELELVGEKQQQWWIKDKKLTKRLSVQKRKKESKKVQFVPSCSENQVLCKLKQTYRARHREWEREKKKRSDIERES